MIQIELFNEVDPKSGNQQINNDSYIIIGPIRSFQWTYGHLRLQTDRVDFDLPRDKYEAIFYDGKYWGDFRVSEFNNDERTVELKTE